MKFDFNFHQGAFIEYKSAPTDPSSLIEFINIDTNEIVYSTTLQPNSWAKTSLKHYIRWEIKASINDKIVFHHVLDLTGKRVIMVFQYTTLGDFLYWMPVFEKFRITHNCQVIVHVTRTGYIDIVQKSYPYIIFTNNYGTMKNESIYAIYEIDLSYSDSKLYNNVFPRFNTPQDVAEKFLGLSKETLPIRIDSTEDKPNIHDKYVCITEHGQSNAEKSWLYPNGWQIVSNYLVGKGYTVIPISSEPTNIKGDNILDKTGLPLKDMIQYIKYADLFIGGSTAPTHISYSLGVPTIMIITNTWLVKEWPINYVYNDDERYCFGCYTKELKKGISSCNKRNPIPECSMSITPNMVINKINEVLLLLD